jgi:glutathione S-transferase
MDIDASRRVLFIHDPDGNVLEFNELYGSRNAANSLRQDVNMIRLYDVELSGNCYKVRLFISLLGLDYERIPINLWGGENRSAEFLRLNPLGEVPVLEDDLLVLRDSQAILVYLARKYDGEAWLPADPAGEAQVVQWLSTAANEIAQGPCAARLHDKFGVDIDLQAARLRTHGIIEFFEKHLSNNHWLALNRPTIADVACFPYIALAPEGGISLGQYSAVNRWIDRMKALSGFIAMPGI